MYGPNHVTFVDPTVRGCWVVVRELLEDDANDDCAYRVLMTFPRVCLGRVTFAAWLRL